MNLDDLSKEELLARLKEVLASNQELADKQNALDAKAQRVVHDLRVHQVELEAQNRALRDTQALLEESQHRYAELYDFAPVAYATLDPRGYIQEINLTGATLLGRDRALLIGVPFLVAVRMDEPSMFWGHLRRCAEERASVSEDLRVSIANKGAMDVQLFSLPVIDSAGKVTAFRTAITDITERKKTERDLASAREAEARAGRRIEALDRASLAVGAALARVFAGNLTDFLQTIVDQARAITGAEFAAIGLRGHRTEPFHPWVSSGMTAEMMTAIGRFPRAVGTLGAVVEGARTLRLRDLRQHPAFIGFPPHHPTMGSFLGVPVRYGEEVLGNLYLANKRGAEEFDEGDEHVIELLADRVGHAMRVAQLNERMEEAVRSRENLLAVVAHDLKSPLSVIKLAAQIMARAPAEGERRKSRKHLDTILRTIDAMTDLIEDLLQASTIEAGAFTVDAGTVEAPAIVAEAVRRMTPLAASKSLELEGDLAPDLPSARCQPERALRVLCNLVGNAIKFTSPGGSIRIRVHHHENKLVFAVSDTGCGIPEAEIPHLFDRYWKGTPGGRQGTGLGLYIAKGVVEAYGGTIWVESRVGAGSTFFFTLPVTAPG